MSTISATAVSAPKPLYQSLFVQVLVALLLGVALWRGGCRILPSSFKILSDAFFEADFDDRRTDRVLRRGARHRGPPATSRRSAGSASRR